MNTINKILSKLWSATNKIDIYIQMPKHWSEGDRY